MNFGVSALLDSSACTMSPALADVALTRHGAVPPAALGAVALCRTHAHVVQALQAQERIRALTEEVSDVLYQLVPSLDGDRTLRRTVVELRRDVHNGRRPRGGGERLEAVCARLDDRTSAALRAWNEAVVARDSARDDAAASLEDELTAAGRALDALLDDDDVARGVALASPTFYEELGRRGSPGLGATPPQRGLARSALAYAARAALKTSPYSSLTRVGVLTSDARDRPSPAPDRVTTLSRGVVVRWLLACAADERTAGAFRYVANDTLRWIGDLPVLLLGAYDCDDGFYWRRERLVDASTVLEEFVSIAGLDNVTHEQVLAALGGERPQRARRRHLALGLLRPVLPWAANDEDPARALASALRAHGHPAGREAADRLMALASSVSRLAHGSGGRRPQLLRTIRSTARTGMAETGVTPPRWLADAPLVYEDVACDAGPAMLPDPVRDDLRRLGSVLRPQIRRTRLYDAIVARFVADYGPGGRTDDVLAFLLGVSRDERLRETIVAAAAADVESSGVAATELPVSRSSAPPTTGVAVQVVSPSRPAVEAGDYMLVLNQHNPGIGATLARFRSVLAGAGLDDGLRAWLARLFPDARVHVLDYGSDFSDLQAGAIGLLPTLRWPGELCSAQPAPGLDLKETSLVHDAHRDVLELIGPDAVPVAPVYLGSVPQYLVGGPVRLLLTIADPWVNVSPAGRFDGRRDLAMVPPVDGVHGEARWSDGRLVLRRASWRMRPEEWPLPGSREGGVAYLERIEHWRRRNRLPMEGFVTLERMTGRLPASARKPMWARFDSLHSLRHVAAAFDDEVVAVRLVEALPSRDQHPFLGPDGAPRATEHLCLLSWERPT